MIYDSAKERAFDYNNSYKNKESIFRLGKIDNIYFGLDSNGEPIRVPLIVFYGEKNSTVKYYKSLSSYTPQVGDHVLLAKINGTYIILGKVNGL